MASDNGTSDDSQENSATEISTDSEFEHDGTTPTQHEIPEITINDAHERKNQGQCAEPKKVHVKSRVISSINGNLKQTKEPGGKLQFSKLDATKVKPEASSPREKLTENSTRGRNTNVVMSPSPLVNPRKGDYLLNRTHSTEGIASRLSLELKKRYLLGGSALGGSVIKSGSTSNVDTKLRNLSDAISQHQKLLNPAPEPSPTMQAFLEGTNKLRISNTTRQSPILPTKIFAASPLKPFPVKESSLKDSRPLSDISKIQLPDLVKETNILKSKTEPNVLRVETTNEHVVKEPTRIQKKEQFDSKDNVVENSEMVVDENDVCRPRSPLHETSIVVPEVDWNKNVSKSTQRRNSSEDSEIDSDSLSSSSDTDESKHEAKKEPQLSINLSPPRLQIHSTDGDLLLDEDANHDDDANCTATFEPDSIEFIDIREDSTSKQGGVEEATYNRSSTDMATVNNNLKKLELTEDNAKNFSNCSSPTSSASNKQDDSIENDVTTAALTETEMSEWARDGQAMVADDLRDVEFDINPEFITLRKYRGGSNEKKKKMMDAKAHARMAKEEDLTDVEIDSIRYDRMVDVPSNDTSKLLANGEDLDYMDTDNESPLDDSLRDATNAALLKNRGYVEFVNVSTPTTPVRPEMKPLVDAPIAQAEIENEFCSDDENVIEINPVTMDDVKDRLYGSTKKSASNHDASIMTIDLAKSDNDETRLHKVVDRELFQTMDEDSLLVVEPAEDTTTSELITILANPINPSTNLVQAQSSPTEEQNAIPSGNDVNNPDYLEYVKRLQSRIAEFSNAKDSIDIRKSKSRNSKSSQKCSTEMIAEEIKSQNISVMSDSFNSPATSRKLEEITRERTKQKTLIQDLLMDKMEAHKQKSAEKKARRAARASSFTACTTMFTHAPSPVTCSPVPFTFVPTSIMTPNNSPVHTTFAEAKKAFHESSSPRTACNSSGLLSTFRSQSSDCNKPGTSVSTKDHEKSHEDAFKTPIAPPRVKHEEARRTAEKAKQEARERARLKSDEDLGLSPEDKIKELRMKVARRQLSMEERRRTEEEVSPDTKTRRYSISFHKVPNKLQTSKSTDNIKTLTKKATFEPLPTGNAKSMDELVRASKSCKPEDEPSVAKREKKKSPKDPERRKSIIKAVSDFFKKKDVTTSPPSQKDKGSMFRINAKSKDKGKVINNSRTLLPILRGEIGLEGGFFQ